MSEVDPLVQLQTDLTEELRAYRHDARRIVDAHLWPLVSAALSAARVEERERIAEACENIDVSMDEAPADLNNNEASSWANGCEAGLSRAADVARGVPNAD